MENKENLAKVINFKEAKKKIVLKKSASQEFRDRFILRGQLCYFPRHPKKFGCPKCGNLSLAMDHLSFRCRICGWYAIRIEECPHCHGDKVLHHGKYFCIQCRAEF